MLNLEMGELENKNSSYESFKLTFFLNLSLIISWFLA